MAGACYHTSRSGHVPTARVCLPAGTHLVFAGDSTLRYQYLMLAYAVTYGHEWAPARGSVHDAIGLIINHNFTAFYLETTAMLAPYEHCDCFR